MHMNKEIDNYIENAPADQKEIMLAIRQLIHNRVKNTVEEFKWGRPVFRLEKDFAYLKTAKNYVTLGFFQAGKINDPGGKLDGTGKDMKHIKLKSLKDINPAELTGWFQSLVK